MPEVNRIQLLGQDDGEDSLNQVQDVGGKAMVDDGLMTRWGIQEVYGLHNMPGLPEG